MDYGISSRDYLARAKECLAKNEHQALFYAAFEIRCGVEARMQEYLEVQKHISKKKRKGWKVDDLARNIEDTFRLGEKDAVVRVRDRATNNVLLEARYTPVRRSLREKAERLGNWLHSAKKYYPPNDPFWAKLRSELETAVVELERATSGTLLGPVLRHPDGKHMDMKLELPTPEAQEAAKRILLGVETVLEVNYE